MLGTDLVRAARDAGHEVVALGHSELDVTDAEGVAGGIASERPDVVVNCAAYTAVDDAEADEATATAVNGEGARAVAAGAARSGAGVAYVSTDYVFDGTKPEPYVESDPPAPRSAYGRSKLAGERATADANPSHWVVRSAWLFGRAGGNFVETMLRLGASRDELRVVDDQVGSPTYTRHLAEALLRLVESPAYGIHHLAGAGSCSWYRFAVAILAGAGVDTRVVPCTTAEHPRPAPRPAFSVLGTERSNGIRLPGWEDGLAGYLDERRAAA